MSSSLHAYLLLTLLALVVIGGCGAMPPRQESSESLVRWQQELTQSPLRLQLVWAMPKRPGPYPTIIVNPGHGQSAADLRPVVDDLASQGYLAVAVECLRLINGNYTSPMFPWRDRNDALQALQMILNNPWVDRERVATLGYSMGGAHSLILAAHSPLIKAVVVYYPMTDFLDWIAVRKQNFIWRLVFAYYRSSYNAESPLNDNSTHKKLLSDYSAINFSDKITVPVLIIHGNRDQTVPLRHSQRFEMALRSHGTISELMVIDKMDHAFNLSPSVETRRSWHATLNWFARYLNNPGDDLVESGAQKGGVHRGLVQTTASGSAAHRSNPHLQKDVQELP